MKTLITLALLTLVASLNADSSRATITFEGDLDGPTIGSASPATGTATLILDDDQTLVTFTITYGNLVGEEIAAHFHTAPPGSFGRIVHELPLGTPKHGTWDIPPQSLQSLLDGHIYVIIHSDAYPAGELGGWVSATQVPTDQTSWTAIRNLYPEEAR